jgi:murein DD-endopeptidase MepM/ murein hydrolase activator NlpD
MKLVDRLLTIVVTATLTSAGWIVFVSVYPEKLGAAARGERAEPAQAAPASGPGRTASPAGSGVSMTIERPDPGQSADLLLPVAGVTYAQLSDTFSDERGGGEHLHEALDIMAPRGTPVLAAAAGTIERLFLSDAGGNTIYVRSPDRKTIHYYAHLDGYAPGLEEGRKVARGEQLGTVGSTGNASPDAPHLHFAIMRTTPGAEWWEPATAVNPYPLLTGKK